MAVKLKFVIVLSFIAVSVSAAKSNALLISDENVSRDKLLIGDSLTSIDEDAEQLLKSSETQPLEPRPEVRPLSEKCAEMFPQHKRYTPKDTTDEESVILESSSGKIRGLKSRLFGKELNTFLGIPFAEAPVNGLRFRKTVPVKPWKGIKNATSFGPHCPQRIPSLFDRNTRLLTYEFSEDCLFMNIWTPSLNSTELRPVLFFLQGGAFDVGRVATDEKDGRVLSVVGNAVVVTINYRLGALGWLNLDIEECPGSQGLYDQATAIEWVKRNARTFGGDPEKITLFGQSAGGMSIGFLMVSPTYGHLVNSAIFQSGTPIFPNIVFTYTEGTALAAVKQVACDFSDDNPETIYDDPEKVLECLMKLPAEYFEKKTNGAGFGLSYFHLPSRNADFPFSLYEGLMNGSYALRHLKQIIVGNNRDEGNLFLPTLFPEMFPLDGAMNLPNITSARKFINFMTNLLIEKLPQLKSRYPQVLRAVDILVGKEPPEDTPRNLFFRAFDKASKFMTICPTKIMSDKLTEMGKTAFTYRFSQRSSWTKWPSWMGVTHGDELNFVFGHPLRYPDQYSGDDIDLSKRIMRSWTNFANNGSPVTQLGVEWSPYSGETKEFMELNGKTAFMGSEDDSKLCQLYEILLDL